MTLRTDAGRGPRRSDRRRTVIGYVPVLALGALLVVSSSAAAHHPPAVKCGDLITKNTKLKADLGPCPGNGLVVKGAHVKLDLGGHSISAANGPEETSGVLLDNTVGAVVRNGTVQGFDAGVNVDGGSGNTVRQILARNNVNDNVAPADPDNPTPEEECQLGDGITVTGSDGNSIVDNDVDSNGPYSGISLVEDSDQNTVKNNSVEDNNLPNEDAAPGVQGNGNCGAPFARPIQDIGIRIEGPGATANTVARNVVSNSAIGGITIHGYIFDPPPPGPDGPPPQDQNTDNVIRNNEVLDTGKDTYLADPLADGIGVLRQGPALIVGVSQGNVIERNTIVRSRRHGIFLGTPTQPGPFEGNTVARNEIEESRLDGILVTAGSVNNTISRNDADDNGEHDGHDANAACDNNAWLGNEFDWVNQACVSPKAGVRPPA